VPRWLGSRLRAGGEVARESAGIAEGQPEGLTSPGFAGEVDSLNQELVEAVAGFGWRLALGLDLSEISRLFEEAVTCFAAGAYTASSMVSRKVLMVCACKEGDTDGKSFVSYVDYITKNVLSYPKARDAIDRIRSIGNDANHDVAFVDESDARLALRTVHYMLILIYSVPLS